MSKVSHSNANTFFIGKNLRLSLWACGVTRFDLKQCCCQDLVFLQVRGRKKGWSTRVWWRRWHWLSGRSVNKEPRSALGVCTVLSAVFLSVLSRSLFTASFTAGEMLIRRSQVICSRSSPDLDGEPVIGLWQFHFSIYIFYYIPVKQGKGGKEQNLGIQ